MEVTKQRILDLWNRVPRSGIEDLITFLQESDFFTAPCSANHHLACPGGLARHSLNVYEMLNCKFEMYRINGHPGSYTPCPFDIPYDSVVICSLGHDLCKVNHYKEGGEPCSDAQFSFLRSLLDKICWEDKPPSQRVKIFSPDGKLKRSIPGNHATILIDWLKNRRFDPMPDLPIAYSVDDQLPLGHGEKSLSILQDFIMLTEVEKLAIRWHMGATEPGTHFNYPAGYAFRSAMERHPLVTLLFTADLEASQILEREEKP